MPENTDITTAEQAQQTAPPKPKQKRPNRSANMQTHLDPDENKKFIENAVAILKLPPIDTDDVEQLQERTEEYFNICARDNIKPCVPGLALAFGVDRATMWRWAHDTGKGAKCTTIKRAYQVLEILMNDYMQNGKINPVSGIFLMKNNLGYTDKQEVVVTPNKPLDGDMTRSPEELRRMYVEQVAENGLPAPGGYEELEPAGGE